MSAEKSKGDTSLSKGINEYARGEYTDAITYLQIAIQNYERALADYDRAVKDAQPGKKDLQVSAPEKDQALHKNFSTAYKALGLAQQASDKTADAIKTYEKALSKGIKEFDIYSNLGFLYLTQTTGVVSSVGSRVSSKIKTNPEKAIENLTEAVKMKSDHYAAQNNLGFAYAQTTQHLKAVPEYKKALGLTKDPVQLLTTHSKLIESALATPIMSGDLHDMLKDAYKFVSDKKEDLVEKNKLEMQFILQHYYASCINLQKDGATIPAIKELYKTVDEEGILWKLFLADITEIKPKDKAETREILKKLEYLKEHDKDAGLDQIKQLAISLIKKFQDCGADLYKIAQSPSEGEVKKALIEYNDDNAKITQGYIKFLEGSEQYKAGNFAEARDSFKSAIEFFKELDLAKVPENMKSKASESLGHAYCSIKSYKIYLSDLRLGQVEAGEPLTEDELNKNLTLAKDSFEKAKLYNQGNNSDINNALGIVYFKQKDLTNAIQSFTEAVQANDKNIKAHYNLGQALKATDTSDNLKLAIKSFEAAKNLKNDDYNTLFNLAECLQKTSDYVGALKEFKQALTLVKSNTKETLNVHCKIIECARELPKESPELRNVSKAGFSEVYDHKAEILGWKDLAVYIRGNYKPFAEAEGISGSEEGISALKEVEAIGKLLGV